MKIAVLSDGSVVVTAPGRVDEKHIASLVQGHAEWIEKMVAKCKKRIAGVKFEKEEFDKTEFDSATRSSVIARHSTIAAPRDIRLGRISVKKMRSRWGSCSPDGNISINLLLGHLPDRLLEYVVVHEVCHLVHHNHSQRFWALVATHLPDHRERKRELRRYGHLLASSSSI